MVAKRRTTPSALYVLLSAFPRVHGLRVAGAEGYEKEEMSGGKRARWASTPPLGSRLHGNDGGEGRNDDMGTGTTLRLTLRVNSPRHQIATLRSQ